VCISQFYNANIDPSQQTADAEYFSDYAEKMTKYVRIKRLQQYFMHIGGVPFLANDSTDDDVEFARPTPTDLLFDQIPSMPKQERARLRNEFPNLPPYIFMTEKEKRTHFKVKSEEFNRRISETPQRVSKTKKIVKFENFFQYRTFRESEAADRVSAAQSVSDRYHP
jgi:hypothetical protein